MINNVHKAIIRTMAFFDIFDYPLTAVEVQRYLYRNSASLVEVMATLEQLSAQKIIETKNGFYFFSGKGNLVAIRQERYNLAEKKFKIALRVARYLSWLPTLKMVAVCNNLAFSNAKKESDIDFFIVVSRSRLWLSRLIITVIVQLLGLRRYGQKITNRICLSFYVTDQSLNLEALTLKPEDPYFYFWLATLTPIYGSKSFKIFWQANTWLVDKLPNCLPEQINYRRRVTDSKFKNFNKRIIEIILDTVVGQLFEKIARDWQLKKIQAKLKRAPIKNDGGVVISDSVLKFHDHDRRQEYLQSWQDNLQLFNNDCSR